MSDYDGQWHIHFSEELGPVRHATRSGYFPGIYRRRGLKRDEDSVSCSELNVVRTGFANRLYVCSDVSNVATT